MPSFHAADLTLDNYWRAIILYGQNVASYKFALGKSLLEISDQGKDTATLEELAEPFSRHMCEHLANSDKQATSRTSSFLEACRSFNNGDTTKDDLIDATVRLAFINVIDAFHVVNRAEVGVRFYEDERALNTKGIRLTDELRQLRDHKQFSNLPHEVEARWRLVETAWDLRLPKAALTVDFDPTTGLLLPDRQRWRRPAITKTRDALNGYQTGRCFYCSAAISLEAGSPALTDVDHFFPHALKPHKVIAAVDGIWNLVLACQTCNRAKSDLLPALKYLERLNTRNDYLIESHHPLRETLIQQTGRTPQARHAFLQQAYVQAQTLLIHTWSAPHEQQPA